MRTVKQLTVFLLIALAFGNCTDKVSTEIRYMANVPIYMTRNELQAGLKSVGVKELKNAGKIYIKDNYLFINEIGKGIHVYNNSNPSTPMPVTFIKIPGNVDIAIRNNLLYADNFTDLLVIDISDLHNVREVERYKNAFPDYYPQYNRKYPVAPVDTSKGMVVGWKVEEITVKKEELPVPSNGWQFGDAQSLRTESVGAGYRSANVGVAGSMARFAINNDILYAINNNFEIRVFDIGKQKIEKKERIRISGGIETLFLRGDNMFIGSRLGMFIYDISNAEKPVFISQYQHISSCDPVVVNDKYAFVTLRTGSACNRGANRLDVVSLEDIKKPYLLKSYDMFNPHGLGIDNNILFVCDGAEGLKVYDANDVLNITKNMIKHFQDIRTYDLIPYKNVLIMTGADGIYQYDYSDIKNIKQISHIPTN